MKYILSIAIILVALSAWGSPSLVSDKQVGVTQYIVTGAPSWLPMPTVVDGGMVIDLANYTEGTWSLKIKACNGVWCGDEADYTLTCPAPLKAPILKIEP